MGKTKQQICFVLDEESHVMALFSLSVTEKQTFDGFLIEITMA